jgi:hypothetical protein
MEPALLLAPLLSMVAPSRSRLGLFGAEDSASHAERRLVAGRHTVDARRNHAALRLLHDLATIARDNYSGGCICATPLEGPLFCRMEISSLLCLDQMQMRHNVGVNISIESRFIPNFCRLTRAHVSALVLCMFAD